MADGRMPGAIRLNKSSLADQAAVVLRKLILTTKLAPGSVVTERDLSSMLGISRTPVREAIHTLISEGLIVASETGRLAIFDPDIETVTNLVRVLGALEGLAAELAAQTATQAELDAIVGHHERMTTMVEDESEFRYFDTNIAFHRAIVAASGNPQLVQVHKTVDDQLYLARYRSSRKKERRSGAVAEHDEVVKALVAPGGLGARHPMVGHLTTTIYNLEAAQAEDAARQDGAAG